MARRRSTFRRKRRERADWVYRGFGLDEEGTPSATVATYTSSALNLANAGSVVCWLYDSKNYGIGLSGDNPELRLPSAARPDGRRPKFLAVDLWLRFYISNWIQNAQHAFGIRIGLYEQDSEDGNALLDPNYSMFYEASLQDQNAVHANSHRTNMWEYRFWDVNVTGDDNTSAVKVVRKRIRLPPLRPGEQEGLGLFIENWGSDVEIRRWCRTLVVDPG